VRIEGRIRKEGGSVGEEERCGDGMAHLLEVDAFTASIRSSEYLHPTMLAIKAAIIGHKWTHAQFLQGMPREVGGGQCMIDYTSEIFGMQM
jgi:hypothetical protein